MIAATQPPLFKPSRAEQTYVIFMRVLSVVSIWYGLAYWLRLIGLEPGPAWRFDLMPMHWQVASVCLAVLYPFAAVGLWLPASWGPVIWFVCAASEIVMHAVYPGLFGRADLLVIAHVAILAALLLLRLLIWIELRRSREQA
ncbi:hypothetical protein CSC94_12430 [Zhengella mangrovi]|uniref:Uncharacterized protein n=1 Tax=Zhengella mangrovi TaxID=1982044 RepID=A0A2G1QN48_9HYPH|nr:DUF6163 family protein [Zhengella mangrovi]PHP66899.1 hypothetical protein CSC94_12430 [Zhengella mangrovi]